ncbi:MAG TPA: M48 family metalloprotease [Alphaproteobacteria bacterium]|nr:M48 family metalloprotease [Alphaproteobacteria bacterium]
MRKLLISIMTAAFLAALLIPAPARAQGLAIARDAEIENTIRAYATPIFDAAGLDPEAVTIRIVNDSDVNAFVLGGQNLFMTVGLLLLAQNANEVIGVIAHETGHIAGGHLARMDEERRNAMLESIIAMVLGAGAMATGSPGAGQAVMAGGAQVAQRQLLANSRAHEAAADQAAVTFLDRTGQSARGLADFLQLLVEREHGGVGRRDQFVLDHPLTPDRVEFVRNQAANSKYSDTPEPPEFQEMFERMQAKLMGFLRPAEDTFRRYPESDTSLGARYARAIAYYRKPDLGHAVPLIDGLIAERPKDPYFEELKGQMLFENGHVREAIAPYQAAVNLLPDNPLLRVSLAQTQLETNDASLNNAALANLTVAIQKDKQFPPAWSQIAVAYGRAGQLGLSALALAEKAYLYHDDKEARAQVARAQHLLPEDSPGWLRAQDIKQAINNRKQ